MRKSIKIELCGYKRKEVKELEGDYWAINEKTYFNDARSLCIVVELNKKEFIQVVIPLKEIRKFKG